MEGTVEGTVFNCLFIGIGNHPKGANCSHWILLDSSKNVLVYSRYLLWILCTLTLRLENSKPHTNGREVVGVTYSKLWLIVKHCGIVYHCPLSAPPCLGWAFNRRWRGKNRIKMLTRSLLTACKALTLAPTTSQGVHRRKKNALVTQTREASSNSLHLWDWYLLGGQKTHLATWRGNDGDVMRPGRSWWSGHDDMQTKSVSAPRQNWCVLKLF